jgi:hypothetical protein
MTEPEIKQQPATLFKDGDMALVLSKDGSVSNVAFNVDSSALSVDPDEMTEEQLDLVLQHHKFFALTLAANSDLIMNILTEIAANPDVIDVDALQRFVRPN